MLTAAAAPDRADRLVVRPGEPPAIVERLAVWALPRATSEAVTDATRLLDDANLREPVTAPEDEHVLAGSAAR